MTTLSHGLQMHTLRVVRVYLLYIIGGCLQGCRAFVCNLAVKTMTRIKPCNPAQPEDDHRPLTAEEALALRAKLPQISVWKVVGLQAIVAVVAAALAWLLTERMPVVWSVAYGGLSVVLPAALFARGMSSRLTRASLGMAVAGFVLWELVKIGLTFAMLFMANRWITDVSWPALLVGFVVTMKVHWVVLGLGRKLHPKVKS